VFNGKPIDEYMRKGFSMFSDGPKCIRVGTLLQWSNQNTATRSVIFLN